MCEEFHDDVFCSFETFIPENVDAASYFGIVSATLMHDEIVEIAVNRIDRMAGTRYREPLGE